MFGYKLIDNHGVITYIEAMTKESLLEYGVKEENIFTTADDCISSAHVERGRTIRFPGESRHEFDIPENPVMMHLDIDE